MKWMGSSHMTNLTKFPRRKSQLLGEMTVTDATNLDSGKRYRDAAFPNAQPLIVTDKWRAVDPRDVHRIECDRFHICGEHATWAMATGSPLSFSYVCDYHRRVFDATGTFWEDGGASPSVAPSASATRGMVRTTAAAIP